CRAGASTIVTPGDRRQGPHLLGGNVAQRETDRDHGVAGLPLRIDIAFEPGVKSLRMWAWTEETTGLRGLVVGAVELIEIRGPARLVRQDGPLFEYESVKLLDTEPRD